MFIIALIALIYYVKSYTLTRKFNFKCICICEQAGLSSEMLCFFKFLLSNKVLIKEDFNCLCLLLGFIFLYLQSL